MIHDERERFIGGSQEQEERLLAGMLRDVQLLQVHESRRSGNPTILRGFHAKKHFGTSRATLYVAGDLPREWQVGHFQPNAEFPATVRFSNASGQLQSDRTPDIRGMAVRLDLRPGCHDPLLTNSPTSHARDPIQFMRAAMALASPPLLVLPRLIRWLGFSETVRLLWNLATTTRAIPSLATAHFWSRTPFEWGSEVVKYQFEPEHGRPAGQKHSSDPNYLRADLVRRLGAGDVSFVFSVQRFRDERRTPIEDGAVEWTESVTSPIRVGRLVLHRQQAETDEARESEAAIEALAFTPWNYPPGFRPLGSLNRARKPVYAASVDLRRRPEHSGAMKGDALDEYDYVIVGSGAGGGPLAANLARAGFEVLVLEAGGDHGEDPFYQVPAFHGRATEHPPMAWDYL